MKREVVVHPRGPPEQPRPKVFGSSAFIGANVKYTMVRLNFRGRNYIALPSIGENVVVLSFSQ